jgi:hypothetical protein
MQTPFPSNNTRADDISAIYSRELPGDANSSQTFSRNKSPELLGFADMTPAPNPSLRKIEEQIALHNDISGLVAWLERRELSALSPHAPAPKIQPEDGINECYFEAVINEEWRTVNGKQIKYYRVKWEGELDGTWESEANICAEMIRLWKEQTRAEEEERDFAATKLLPSSKRKGSIASFLSIPPNKRQTPQHSRTVLPPTLETLVTLKSQTLKS